MYLRLCVLYEYMYARSNQKRQHATGLYLGRRLKSVAEKSRMNARRVDGINPAHLIDATRRKLSSTRTPKSKLRKRCVTPKKKNRESLGCNPHPTTEWISKSAQKSESEPFKLNGKSCNHNRILIRELKRKLEDRSNTKYSDHGATISSS